MSFLIEALRHQDDQEEAYIEAYQSSHGQEEPPQEDAKAKYASMQMYWEYLDGTLEPIRAKPDSYHAAAYAASSWARQPQ